MRAYDAKNIDEVCDLKRDNKTIGDFWMLTDGYNVSIVRQKIGEPPTEKIDVPRKTFNRLVDWYMSDQHAKKPSKKPARKRKPARA